MMYAVILLTLLGAAAAAPLTTTGAPLKTTAAPLKTTAAPLKTTAAPLKTTAAPQKSALVALGDKRGNQVWTDFGSVARYEIGVWEANIPSAKWKLLAHHAQSNWEPLKTTIHAFKDNSAAQDSFATPTNFTQIWNSDGDTIWGPGSFWRMVCPAGYVALGDVAFPSKDLKVADKTMFEKFRCIKEDLTEACRGWGIKLWDNDNSIARKDASAWPTVPESTGYSEFFYTHDKHNDRPALSPKCIKKSSFSLI